MEEWYVYVRIREKAEGRESAISLVEASLNDAFLEYAIQWAEPAKKPYVRPFEMR